MNVRCLMSAVLYGLGTTRRLGRSEKAAKIPPRAMLRTCTDL